MKRISTGISRFLLIALALTGCRNPDDARNMVDKLLPGRQPNSRRTDSSYKANPLTMSEQDKRLQSYLDRLDSIEAAQSDTTTFRPRNLQIPILPADINMNITPQGSGAFSQNAQLRNVHIPANTRTSEGPVPGQITPITPMAAQPTAPAASQPKPANIANATKISAAPEPAYSAEDTAPTEGNFNQLIGPYRQQAEQEPNNLDKQLQLRLLLAAAGMRQEALEPIAMLSESENQRIADILLMIMSLRDRPQLAPTPEEAAEQVEALERLMQQLQAMADLRVPRMVLCKSVNSFGNYEQFEKYQFKPGQAMVVYCEVKNFSVEDKGDGRYSTVLDLELGLYNNLGALVRPMKKTNGIEDVSANRRNDFFLTDFYYVPSDIPPGEYTLKAIVRDPRVNKVATSAVDINVIADETTAQ